jgi:hypothetical protein
MLPVREYELDIGRSRIRGLLQFGEAVQIYDDESTILVRHRMTYDEPGRRSTTVNVRGVIAQHNWLAISGDSRNRTICRPDRLL